MKYVEYVRLNNLALSEVPETEIHDFIEAMKDLRRRSGTLFVVGNGGSAASASHAVADFSKTIKIGKWGAIKTISISEMVSLQTAYANDESFEFAAARTLETFASNSDAVLVVSVSGKSPNLLQVVQAAKDAGVETFSLVGSRGRVLADACDHSIVISSADYQIVENAHMTLIHWFVKVLSND